MLNQIRVLDVTRFVPGHGSLMTTGDVAALRNAMARFHLGVQDGYRNGLSEAEIRKALDLSFWERLERAYVIGRNINRAYLEIEADSFEK